MARLVRAQFRSLREADFVMAARSLGYSNLRIIAQEILPNALPPVIVAASVMIANAILTEAGPLLPQHARSQRRELGRHDRRRPRSAAHRLVPDRAARRRRSPLAVLSLNLVGDGLNEILNPRSDP